ASPNFVLPQKVLSDSNISEYAFGLQSSAYCRSDDFWMSDESPSASRLLRLADGLVSDSPEGCDSCFPGG
ncbi:hypothetical protein, partial [Duncaniella freteri]|uniref:hypothetical protein n=1 Tax=Duncaniella freteri TaxID=2530391 RepID=UPI0025778837